MTKYIVKRVRITYKYVEAESEEKAKEFAYEPDEKTDDFEDYVEVEEDY